MPVPPLTHTELSTVVSSPLSLAVSFASQTRPNARSLTRFKMGYMSLSCWIIVYR